jgi:hypothetical protein
MLLRVAMEWMASVGSVLYGVVVTGGLLGDYSTLEGTDDTDFPLFLTEQDVEDITYILLKLSMRHFTYCE